MKNPVAFRLSDYSIDVIDSLAKHHNWTRTQALEEILRLYDEEQAKQPPKKARKKA